MKIKNALTLFIAAAMMFSSFAVISASLGTNEISEESSALGAGLNPTEVVIEIGRASCRERV